MTGETVRGVEAATSTGLRRRLRRRWDSLPLAWRRALVATAILRLALAVLPFALGGLLPGLDPVSVQPVAGTGFEGWEAHTSQQQGVGLLGAGLERYDALWYLSIARDGYPPSNASGTVPGAAAFFPGWPLVLALFGRVLGGAYVLAGSLAAFAATVAGLAGIHRMLEDETGDLHLARRAVTTAAVFPSAFFLLAPYTEALFLAVTVWAVVLARRGRWGVPIALGTVAGLTRNVGVLLVLPLAIEVVRQRAHQRPAAWVAVASPLLGLALYLGYGLLRFGTFLGPVEAQADWQREAAVPLVVIADAVRFGVQTAGHYATGYHSLDLLVFVPVAAASVWLLRRAPLSLALYTAAHVLAWLAYPFPSRPLMSTPRFAVVVFPIFWVFAAWTRHRVTETTWIATSACLLGVHLALFINWYYIF